MDTENVEILLTKEEAIKKVKQRIQDFEKVVTNVQQYSNSIFKSIQSYSQNLNNNQSMTKSLIKLKPNSNLQKSRNYQEFNEENTFMKQFLKIFEKLSVELQNMYKFNYGEQQKLVEENQNMLQDLLKNHVQQVQKSIQYYNSQEAQFREIDKKYIKEALGVESSINHYLQTVQNPSLSYNIKESNKRYETAMTQSLAIHKSENECQNSIELMNSIRKAVSIDIIELLKQLHQNMIGIITNIQSICKKSTTIISTMFILISEHMREQIIDFENCPESSFLPDAGKFNFIEELLVSSLKGTPSKSYVGQSQVYQVFPDFLDYSKIPKDMKIQKKQFVQWTEQYLIQIQNKQESYLEMFKNLMEFLKTEQNKLISMTQSFKQISQQLLTPFFLKQVKVELSPLIHKQILELQDSVESGSGITQNMFLNFQSKVQQLQDVLSTNKQQGITIFSKIQQQIKLYMSSNNKTESDFLATQIFLQNVKQSLIEYNQVQKTFQQQQKTVLRELIYSSEIQCLDLLQKHKKTETLEDELIEQTKTEDTIEIKKFVKFTIVQDQAYANFSRLKDQMNNILKGKSELLFQSQINQKNYRIMQRIHKLQNNPQRNQTNYQINDDNMSILSYDSFNNSRYPQQQYDEDIQSVVEDETVFEVKTNEKQLQKSKQFLEKRLKWERNEELKGHFACSLYNNILLQGRLYITNKRLIFHSYFNPDNFFFKETLLQIPKNHIIAIEKRQNALKMDNAITIQTQNGNLFFSTFIYRNLAYDKIIAYLIPGQNNKNKIPQDQILNNSMLQDKNQIKSQQLAQKEERRLKILENLQPVMSEFNIGKISHIFEGRGLTVSHIFNCFYADNNQYLPSYITQDYPSYLHYYKQQHQKCEQVEISKWFPQPPNFYTMIDKQKWNSKCEHFSEKNLNFNKPILQQSENQSVKKGLFSKIFGFCSLKNRNKKQLSGIMQKLRIYWVSDSELIIDSYSEPKEINKNNIYNIRFRILVAQTGKDKVQMQNKFRIQFLKKIPQQQEKQLQEKLEQHFQNEFVSQQIPLMEKVIQEYLQNFQEQQIKQGYVMQDQEQLSQNNVDFSQRRVQIFQNQIEKEELYTNLIFKETFQNQTVQKIFLLFFSDLPFTSPQTQKQYQSFWVYLNMEKSQGNSNLENPTKWNPSVPEFYQNLEPQNQNNLQALNTHGFVSQRELKYEKSLDDMKGIPFLPKFCKIQEKWSIFWISNKELILQDDNYTSGAPVSDSQFVRVRYHILQQGNSVQIEVKFYVNWLKSSILKSTVESKALEKTNHQMNNILVPTIKEILQNQQFQQQFSKKFENSQMNGENKDNSKDNIDQLLKEREIRIINSIDKDDTFPNNFSNELLENTTVKQVFEIYFNEKPVKSEDTGKEYPNYICYTISEDIKGKPTKVSKIFSNTEWTSIPDCFTPQVQKIDKKQKQQLLQFQDYSERQIDYQIDLKELQLIPLAPKHCVAQEKWKVYWLNTNYLIMDYDFYSKGYPYAESYFARSRMELIQEGNNVRYIFRMKIVWLQSILLKSLIIKTSAEETKIVITENFVPRMKKLLPLYQQKYKQQFIQNPEDNDQNKNDEDDKYSTTSSFISNTASQFQNNSLKDFSNRKSKISSQLFDTGEIKQELTIPDLIFENCSVKQFYMLMFSDQEFQSSKTNKIYRNFTDFLYMEDKDGDQHSIKSVDLCTKWNPEPPKYFSNMKSFKKDVFDLKNNPNQFSTRDLEYTVDLKDFKNIPFMPKECKGKDTIKIFWMAYNHLVVEIECNVQGVPMSDSFYTFVKYEITQEGKNVRFKDTSKNIWSKSSLLKNKMDQMTFQDRIKFNKKIFEPVLKRELPIMVQKMEALKSGKKQQQQGDQSMDFSQRKQKIESQLKDMSLFNIKVGEKIFQQTNVQQFVSFMFSDEKYQNYENFYHYLLAHDKSDNINFNLNECQWTIPVPSYFKQQNQEQLEQNKQKQLQELFHYQEFSLKKFSYTRLLTDMKNVPFAPKQCEVTEIQKIYWISPDYIILEIQSITTGVPASDTNNMFSRYLIQQQGNDVKFEQVFYIEWLKSSWMKNTIIEKSTQGIKKNFETNIIPKLESEFPKFLNNLKSLQNNDNIQDNNNQDLQNKQEFIQRKQKIYGQIIPQDKYDTILAEQIFQNIDVRQFVNLVYSENSYISPETQQQYKNFFLYLQSDQISDNSKFDTSSQFNPPFPDYFENIQENNYLDPISDVLQSKRVLKYERFLSDMKNVPFAPKQCDITENLTINWVSQEEIIVDIKIDVGGVPASDTNNVNLRWIITKNDENSIKLQIVYYLQWHKSTWMKSMITKESLNGTKKQVEQNLIPKLQLCVPLFVKNLQNKVNKNIDLGEPINKKLNFNKIDVNKPNFDNRRQQIISQIKSDVGFHQVCSEIIPNCNVFDLYNLRFKEDNQIKSKKTQQIYPNFEELLRAEVGKGQSNYQQFPFQEKIPQYFENRTNPGQINECPISYTSKTTFEKELPKIPFAPSKAYITQTDNYHFVSPQEIIITSQRIMKPLDAAITHVRINIIQEGSGVRFEFKFINEFIKSTMMKGMIESKSKEQITKMVEKYLIPMFKQYIDEYVKIYNEKYPLQDDNQDNQNNNQQIQDFNNNQQYMGKTIIEQQQEIIQENNINQNYLNQGQQQQNQKQKKVLQTKKQDGIIKQTLKMSLKIGFAYFILYHAIDQYAIHFL